MPAQSSSTPTEKEVAELRRGWLLALREAATEYRRLAADMESGEKKKEDMAFAESVLDGLDDLDDSVPEPTTD